jgi:hypothetical protein
VPQRDSFELICGGKAYVVPKKQLYEFFFHHRDCLDAPSYAVRSAVPPAVFQECLNWLKDPGTLTITKDNFRPLSALATELGFAELTSACEKFSSGPINVLFERLAKLEGQVTALKQPDLHVAEALHGLERGIENLAAAFAQMQKSYDEQLAAQARDIASLRAEIRGLSKPPGPPAKPPRPEPRLPPLKSFPIPLKTERSLDGVIANLTKKAGGNVHTKGVVTITSKSIESGPIENIATLGSEAHFYSKNQPGQWICWNFNARRVVITNYTINGIWLKSWILEGSMDEKNWTEIDQQKNHHAFKVSWDVYSFAVAKPGGEYRYVRLTEREGNEEGGDMLRLRAVEFFRVLLE